MNRSDIPLASAERLASSGVTDEQRWAASRIERVKAMARDILLIDLTDPTLTPSQYDRAVKLGREIAQTSPSVK